MFIMHFYFLPAGRARSARPAGNVFRLSVCMYVCMYACVCVRPQISRALSNVICYYATIAIERSGSY